MIRTRPTEVPPRELPSIRIIGTQEEVQLILSRITEVLDVPSPSRPFPRRDDPGRVTVHAEVIL